MRRFVLFVMATLGCLTASPQAEKIRVTSNPEIVRGCKFLGNVKASTGFHGSGQTIGENNVEVTMRERTLGLGGDTLFWVKGGLAGEGEAYRCEGEPHEPIK